MWGGAILKERDLRYLTCRKRHIQTATMWEIKMAFQGKLWEAIFLTIQDMKKWDSIFQGEGA